MQTPEEMMIPVVLVFGVTILGIAALVIWRLLQTARLREDMKLRGFAREPFRFSRAFHYSLAIAQGKAEVYFSKMDCGARSHYLGSSPIQPKYDHVHVFKYTPPEELNYALEIDSSGLEGKSFSFSAYPKALADKLRASHFEDLLVERLGDRGPLMFRLRDDSVELWAWPVNDAQVMKGTLEWLTTLHDEAEKIIRGASPGPSP